MPSIAYNFIRLVASGEQISGVAVSLGWNRAGGYRPQTQISNIFRISDSSQVYPPLQ